jgi:hypothetical protein
MGCSEAMLGIDITVHKVGLQYSVAVVRKRTIPTERPPLGGEVSRLTIRSSYISFLNDTVSYQSVCTSISRRITAQTIDNLLSIGP